MSLPPSDERAAPGVYDPDLLDDPRALEAVDRGEMLRALASAGAQIREAQTFAAEAGVAAVMAEDGRPRSVVVAALGGSAVVADLLGALAGDSSPVPVVVRHSGTVPAWVGPLDLVVAVSLSGAAGEPLALASEAARRGCRLLSVGAPRSPLAETTGLARGVHVTVGAGRRSSRANLWALLTPVLVAADALDLVDTPAEALEAAADRLDEVAEQCRVASEAFVNPAKSLAADVAGSVPLVLGNGDLLGVAARRAASQFARNARHPAVEGTLPDAASGVVATFDGPFARRAQDLFADPDDQGGGPGARLRLLLLRDVVEDTVARRMAGAVRETAEDSGVVVNELIAEGTHPLERLASVMGLTDFASVYLALAHGLDPSTSGHVADLKERIR
jgi:D-arabinose 5-phosphate isomerase GutQ